MGRSGLPPLPRPPPPLLQLLLLAGLATLLLPEPVAEGKSWPGRRREAGAAEGRGRVGVRHRNPENTRPGRADLGGGPKLEGRDLGTGGGAVAVCSQSDLGAPTPNFLSSGALLAGWKGKEWGSVLSGQRGCWGLDLLTSVFLVVCSPFPVLGTPILPTPRTMVFL